MRPTLHAPALIGLVALPLVLSASQVEAQLAASDAATAPATRDVTTSGRPDLSHPTTTPPALLPAEYEVPSRPGLGESSAGEIPWVALQAYKRAADILAEVDPSCGISWAMLAAVGQVESEHGRAGGGDLGDDGVVHPAIVTRGADAAVGPMQLLPDAWKMARVDGDGDGTRSPQDLDDAAVAAGVYLCAIGTDLRTPDGAQKALLAYNSSQTYVDQVLALTTRYGKGDYAVAEPPVPQTIGVMLDYGLGTPAEKDSERDERRRPAADAAEPAEEREYTARLSTEPRSEPAGTADEDERVGLLAAAPSEEPSPEPSETTTAEPTAESAIEPTADPTTASTGTPDETPSGTPTEAPSGSPSAGPAETPTEPPTTEVTGVWTRCEESYCLGELSLDLSEAGEPTEVAAEDLDGDGAVEALAQELEGLVGREVVLTVEEGTDPLVVVAVRAGRG
ncbi:MAG TPA: lytic transglycosylase domain-containing protein [Nocardioidaceae bacterium]|nr:lytic transglycosylase domain-containing protein [Nocardioidaceae bacterium]